MSVKAQILSVLARRGQITALDAIKATGAPSAPRRLREIQEEGQCVGQFVTRNGKRYKVYHYTK